MNRGYTLLWRKTWTCSLLCEPGKKFFRLEAWLYIIDRFKTSDFKTEVLFDSINSLYRQKHGLTLISNFPMHNMIDRERMHPAIVRQMDYMCRLAEL
jgi:hypothetical protein